MKKFTLALTLGLCVFSFFKVSAQSAPDQFGYTYKTDTSLISPPEFSWIDISNPNGSHPGIQVTNLGDDNGTALFPMGFNFQYYFGSYENIALGVNGWISFNKGTVLSPTFPTVPTAGGKANNFIAPFLSDLNFAGDGNPGKMYYFSNNKDTFIVSYENVPFWVDARTHNGKQYGTGTSTFQVILSAVDSSITINYLKTADSIETSSGLQCGMENVSGQIGFLVFADASPKDSTVVRIYYPKVVTAVVKDVATNWNGNPDNSGFFIPKSSDPIELRTNVLNVGNVDMPNLTITGSMKKGSSTKPVGSATISLLKAGQDSTITFTGYTPNTVGVYSFVSTVTASPKDAFSGNNTLSSEVHIVDINKDNIELSYASMAAVGDGNFGLSGQNTGSGILVFPPFYPAIITQAQFIPHDANANVQQGDPLSGGYKYLIMAADSATGAPGNILYQDTIPSGPNQADVLNTHTLKTPVTISKGGFFLFFYPDTASVSIATESTPPYSFRTYEAIAGTISPWRQGDAGDFQMAVIVENPNKVGVSAVEANKNTVSQNRPNPVNTDFTLVDFNLAKSSVVEFVISDILGQEVERINMNAAEGMHQLKINTARYTNGVYFYTMNINNASSITKKMVVNK